MTASAGTTRVVPSAYRVTATPWKIPSDSVPSMAATRPRSSPFGPDDERLGLDVAPGHRVVRAGKIELGGAGLRSVDVVHAASVARAVPEQRGSSALVEDALQVPGAADLVEEDRAQQAGAGDDLVAGARDRLAPPAVVHPPAVADADLAVVGAVHAEADRGAGGIGLDLDQRMVERSAGSSSRCRPAATDAPAAPRSAARWLARHRRPSTEPMPDPLQRPAQLLPASGAAPRRPAAAARRDRPGGRSRRWTDATRGSSSASGLHASAGCGLDARLRSRRAIQSGSSAGCGNGCANAEVGRVLEAQRRAPRGREPGGAREARSHRSAARRRRVRPDGADPVERRLEGRRSPRPARDAGAGRAAAGRGREPGPGAAPRSRRTGRRPPSAAGRRAAPSSSGRRARSAGAWRHRPAAGPAAGRASSVALEGAERGRRVRRARSAPAGRPASPASGCRRPRSGRRAAPRPGPASRPAPRSGVPGPTTRPEAGDRRRAPRRRRPPRPAARGRRGRRASARRAPRPPPARAAPARRGRGAASRAHHPPVALLDRLDRPRLGGHGQRAGSMRRPSPDHSRARRSRRQRPAMALDGAMDALPDGIAPGRQAANRFRSARPRPGPVPTTHGRRRNDPRRGGSARADAEASRIPPARRSGTPRLANVEEQRISIELDEPATQQTRWPRQDRPGMQREAAPGRRRRTQQQQLEDLHEGGAGPPSPRPPVPPPPRSRHVVGPPPEGASSSARGRAARPAAVPCRPPAAPHRAQHGRSGLPTGGLQRLRLAAATQAEAPSAEALEGVRQGRRNGGIGPWHERATIGRMFEFGKDGYSRPGM